MTIEDYRDPETLCRLYWQECLTIEQMAERLYTTHATIWYWMAQHGIPADTRRSGRHAKKRLWADGTCASVSEIARKYNLKTRTIYRRLKNGDSPEMLIRPAKRTGRPRG